MLLRLALAVTCVCSALLAETPALTTDAPEGYERLLRQLRSDSMRSISTTQQAVDLMKAVDRLQSMRVPDPSRRRPQPTAPQPTSAPATSATQPAGPVKPAGPLTPDVLAAIVGRPLSEMANPIALADALFLSDQPKAAYAVYESALASEKAPASRAWMLFQMGNCRRQFDPAGSRAIYQRLLAEHPESPWISVAKTCDVLTEWYAINRPAQMLSDAAKSAEPTRHPGPR